MLILIGRLDVGGIQRQVGATAFRLADRDRFPGLVADAEAESRIGWIAGGRP